MPIEIDHFLYLHNKNVSFDPHTVQGGSFYKTDFLEPIVSVLIFCTLENEGSIILIPGMEYRPNLLQGMIYENDRDQKGESISPVDTQIILEECQAFSIRMNLNPEIHDEGLSKEILLKVVPETY